MIVGAPCENESGPKPDVGSIRRGLTLNRTRLDRRAAMQSICAIPGCGKEHVARGYCSGHYQRLKRHGDPLAGGAKRRDMRTAVDHRAATAAFFWSRVEKHADGCWMWTGGWNRSTGYGVFSFDGRAQGAHRVAYQLVTGPIPDGLVIDHLCSVRRCVNPDHLEAVTDAENRRRGLAYAVRNGARTACPKGHEYTDENTIWRHGIRFCRACKTAWDRARHQRRRALEHPETTDESETA